MGGRFASRVTRYVRCLVKFEFQINECFYSVSMFQMLHGTCSGWWFSR